MLFSQGIFTGMCFWPQSMTCIGTQSICTSMKSFHAIKEEIKSESPACYFFPSPDCITKEGRNNGGIGLLRDPRLRCTAEMHSITRRACRLWPDLLQLTHIANIAFPAVSPIEVNVWNSWPPTKRCHASQQILASVMQPLVHKERQIKAEQQRQSGQLSGLSIGILHMSASRSSAQC